MFEQTVQGSTWKDPTKEESDKFISDLVKPRSKDGVSLPPAISSQLSSLMEATLSGAKRLSESNTSLYASIGAAAGKGMKPVDIIIPVYSNMQVLKPCLEAIYKHTSWPFKLTLVDDCSPDGRSRYWLSQLTKTYPDIHILFNNKNKGFAATVNKGIRATKGEYVCVLNSDVLVTPGWLTKLVLALEVDEKNKIVNPMTNNTALIQIPLQPGFSYLDMNKAFEATSSHKYPEIMPTGFCFMFERDLIHEIGTLDEGYENYGEETDYWMRVISHVIDGRFPQWRAILADDTYIFHERGTSFSSLGDSKHMAKRQTGSARFHAVWPSFKQWQKSFDINKVMAPLRIELPEAFSKKADSLYNISFVVHSTGMSGGMQVIADVINELVERGEANVTLSLIRRDTEDPIDVVGNLRIAPIVFDSIEDFQKDFKEKVFTSGVLVAATTELLIHIDGMNKDNTDYTTILFAQSDDYFLSPDDMKKKIRRAYKKVDHIISGSQWVTKKIEKESKRKILATLNPGINRDLFYPRNRDDGDERPTVLFLLLGTMTYRGYKRGVETAQHLAAICKRNDKNIRMMAYGVLSVPDCPDIIGLGGIAQSHLATLLGTEVDIFCDPSHIHSYGLPSLEAIASGVLPVCWDNKGINAYTTKKNSVIVKNGTPPDAVANKMYNVLFDNDNEIRRPDVESVVKHDRHHFVDSFIGTVEAELKLRTIPKDIAVITPHLRKHGGPTTILNMANSLQKRGHNVKLYTIYPDINPEVVQNNKVPIHVQWKKLRPCDVLITNSDNEHNEFFSKCPVAKKKIMLKLSHNRRFQQLENDSLTYNWDHIITSTKWLQDICETPDSSEGWTYKPVKAKRVGWVHYGHDTFACPPTSRTYGNLNTRVTIGFLAHHHVLKGTDEALKALSFIKQKYHNSVDIVGVGEWPQFRKLRPNWVGYAFSPSRENLAKLFQTIDIWFTASHTEGLGRMALEAMSSSCATVLTNTGAEFAQTNKNCLLVDVGNIKQMVLAIDKLIQDKDLFASIVRSGFETACRYADPAQFVRNIEEVIDGD